MAHAGIFYPPQPPVQDLIRLTKQARERFSRVWLPDQPIAARHAYVTLGAMAQAADIDIGVNVTHLGRNPIEIAQAFTSISELTEREIMIGLGAGSELWMSIFARRRPVAAMREAILLIRKLHSGEPIELDDYPELGKVFGYRQGGRVAEPNRPNRKLPIFLAAAGPNMQRLAGEVADGIIFHTSIPSQCISLVESDLFATRSGIHNVEEASAGRSDFVKMVGIGLSVAQSEEAALNFARRHVAHMVGGHPAFDDLKQEIGIPRDEIDRVRKAFHEGRGADGAMQEVADETVRILIPVGTPEQLIPRLGGLLDKIRGFGFEMFNFDVPLGPDLQFATEAIGTKIAPALGLDK